MPNIVSNIIRIFDEVTESKKQILKGIKEKGLCEYYIPIPKELDEACQSFDNEQKYEVQTSYSWAIENYGTKWGDIGLEVDVELATIKFISAWHCISPNVINMFANDFSHFEYEWEEEQGFGEAIEYSKGEVISVCAWDSPSINYHEYRGVVIIELLSYYKECEVGYYNEYGIAKEFFLGVDLDEVKRNIDLDMS